MDKEFKVRYIKHADMYSGWSNEYQRDVFWVHSKLWIRTYNIISIFVSLLSISLAYLIFYCIGIKPCNGNFDGAGFGLAVFLILLIVGTCGFTSYLTNLICKIFKSEKYFEVWINNRWKVIK